MVKLTKRRRSKKSGLPPGTLVYTGDRKAEEKVRITIIDYNEKHFQETEAKTVEECFPFRDEPTVTWINVDGIHDVSIIEKIGTHFNLHPLIQEDILHTDQRPKLEDLESHLYIVLKMLTYQDESKEVHGEQISIVLGKNVVISFQETRGDVFDPIRDRIRTGKGRIRKMGADYLAYCLIDAIVDNYFHILEKIGEDIEEVEDELVTDPRPDTLQIIHDMKRELIYLRKSLWPLREVISALQRGESPLIKKGTMIYLRDVYDHTIQVIDTIETYRDMVSGMLDTYLSSISNKMNEVMKVLTIIATIFIPITFVAGIYGMNFDAGASPWNMPELGWKYGYPAVWLVMITVALVMINYFKKKDWL